MEKATTYIGSFLVGLGIMGVVWVIMQILWPKANKKRIPPYVKWIIFVLSFTFCLLGWHLYSGVGKLPIGGTALGLVLGIRLMINRKKGWGWF